MGAPTQVSKYKCQKKRPCTILVCGSESATRTRAVSAYLYFEGDTIREFERCRSTSFFFFFFCGACMHACMAMGLAGGFPFSSGFWKWERIRNANQSRVCLQPDWLYFPDLFLGISMVGCWGCNYHWLRLQKYNIDASRDWISG